MMTTRVSVLVIAMWTAVVCVAQTTEPRSDARSIADSVFQRADRDGDGFIDAGEAPPRAKAMLPKLDKDHDGRLSESEFRESRPTQVGTKRGKQLGRRPGEVVAPAAKEERYPEVLKIGDVAPEFTLPRVDATGTVSLSELRRDKPVVLVFGSISCSPFRREVQSVEKLYQQHGDRVNFVMIYIREAHPDSEIFVKNEQGDEVLEKFTQTDEFGLRKSHAQYCERTLDLSFPMLMDSVDNQTNMAYSGWPIRLVIVGTDGKVVSPGAPGPQGFSPEAVTAWARELTSKSEGE